MARRLVKFKISGSGEVVVKHEVDRKGGSSDVITVEAGEAATAGQKAALQAMVEHVLVIAELPVSWRETLTVIGVSVSNTNDVQGIVITAMRDLEGSNSPLIINTPHFTREPYGETGDGMNVFSSSCAADLDILEQRALEYADGARAQGELDFGSKPAMEGQEAPKA